VRVRTCWPASLNPVLPDLSRSDSSPCAEAFSSELDVLNVVQSSDIDHPEQLLRLQQYYMALLRRSCPMTLAKSISHIHSSVWGSHTLTS
jgi:hypothetical protein